MDAARSAGKKALRKKTEPSNAKPARPLRKKMGSKPKSNLLVCRYCGSPPGAEFHQAAGSPLPQMFQSTLWVGGTGEEGEGQEVASPQLEMRGGLARARPFFPFGISLPLFITERSQGSTVCPG